MLEARRRRRRPRCLSAFTWRDGERLIRFGPRGRRGAELLEERGFDDVRAAAHRARAARRAALADARRGRARPGRVDEISAELLAAHSAGSDRPPGGARRRPRRGHRQGDRRSGAAARCGAIPTTLSGAEMTPFHRTPAGVEGARLVRPALVLADPDLMACAPASDARGQRDERAGARDGGALHAARQPGDDHGRAAGRELLRGVTRSADRGARARGACSPATRRARPASRCTTRSARRSSARPGRLTPRRTR